MLNTSKVNKEDLKKWYRSERRDINIMFGKIMRFCKDSEIFFKISNQQFYDKFVEFIYNNSYLKKNSYL